MKLDEAVKQVIQESAVDEITVDVPLFIRLLEYAREDAKTDMDLHEVAEKATTLTKKFGCLSMKNYNSLV